MFTKYYTRLLLITAALCALYGKSHGQDKNIPKDLYIASTIPDSLKEDANSVVRYSNDEVTVKGPGKMLLKHHSIITILNEKDDNEAVMQMGYNKKYDSYSSIEMNVFDALGKQIKKYRKSDMYDGSQADDETMVTNERFLAVKHAVASYPITIEKIYEEDESSFIGLDSWYIQNQVEQSAQFLYYKISYNPTIGLRFKNTNTKIKPEKGNADGLESYTWKAQNLKAIKKEENVLLWSVLPKISFAASSFDCYGYPGDFSSWQSFGNWIKALYADGCTLSPERAAEVKKMTDTIKTDKEKARFLYNYMQKSMRYVGIQLGIGGYKPFPATFVDQKKYGDCKALSNYMRALLTAVNINSYYTVIRSANNAEPIDATFPANTFNHVVLCVPFKNDTTWLECTSNTRPFGKMDPSTENTKALLITENGGRLINTPKSLAADNQFNSEVHIVLDVDGGAKAQLKILSTGIYRSDYIGVAALKTDEQKEYIIRDLHMKQPSVFSFTPSADNGGVKEVDISLEYDKFCDVATADKQFYKPSVFSLWQGTVPIVEKRKNDFYFDTPLQKSCVTTIDLPAGFEVEALPANQTLKFTYGSYDVKYVYDATKNQVTGTAKFNLTDYIIPAAKYTEMQIYMDAVIKAQNKKLVIRRKA
ncbi:DUF3857 and transglutaminase domain-containing protein [Mucilaginibacter dorajii]|uniref:DUF3857 domain-containing protein n=1 Tax=Mucilaginibacter dorajii TaxID=692994 RepID=A0ABP7QHK3_9SPHI|nr:DUF3857 and transglutaminase domain-containing protein [Mucilaginibacter dorajii]MCS3736121.1 hypothetical protein [Mucilaginibacter dorajii]